MITAQQWRKLALSLPESEEKSHFEQPDFRVRNKIYAGLDGLGELGKLKLSPEAQAMAMEGCPKGFHPAAGVWGQRGWTYVVLAHVELAQVRELMTDAYRSVAPKRLAALLSERAAPARPRKAR